MRKSVSALARGCRCRKVSHLASLVLGDLVLGVLVTLLGLAVSPAGLGNVDLYAEMYELPLLVKKCNLLCRQSPGPRIVVAKSLDSRHESVVPQTKSTSDAERPLMLSFPPTVCRPIRGRIHTPQTRY